MLVLVFACLRRCLCLCLRACTNACACACVCVLAPMHVLVLALQVLLVKVLLDHAPGTP